MRNIIKAMFTLPWKRGPRHQWSAQQLRNEMGMMFVFFGIAGCFSMAVGVTFIIGGLDERKDNELPAAVLYMEGEPEGLEYKVNRRGVAYPVGKDLADRHLSIIMYIFGGGLTVTGTTMVLWCGIVWRRCLRILRHRREHPGLAASMMPDLIQSARNIGLMVCICGRIFPDNELLVDHKPDCMEVRDLERRP